jgi:hypothetical protein
VGLARADVPTLLRELDAVDAAVARELGALTPAQLNWKPDASEWSVGQCIDHLIVATTTYFPVLEAIRTGTKRSSVWERLPILPSVFGKLLLRVLDPDKGRKVQAPPAMRPTQSAIEPAILERFAGTNRRLREFINATSSPEALRTRVTSPVARFVTYSLLDGYRIIVTHDRLHLQQARNVMRSTGFPKSSGGPQ